MVRILERYAMYEAFASGGMAVVHYGRVLGAVGFSRPVAIKKLHPHFASDPAFVAGFLDEARLAARVQHPNVVQTLDAVSSQGELFVVLEYVHGASLAQLLGTVRERGERVPPAIAAAILTGTLEGLHAAHQARDAQGERLELVHRDVSPQNVLVGTDGIARVLDFGVAKARGRSQVTQDGAIKGKLAYMAPEQIRGQASPASDVFAAAIVLWECLTGARLFVADDEGGVIGKLMYEAIPSPAGIVPDLPAALVTVVMRGLSRELEQRYATAREMAAALQASTPVATTSEVAAWVASRVDEGVAQRAARLAEIEQAPASDRAPPVASAPTSVRSPAPVRDPYATVPEDDLAQPVPSPPPRRRRGTVLLALVAGALVLAAVVVLSTRARPGPPPVVATEPAPVAPASIAPVTPAVPAPAASAGGADPAPSAPAVRPAVPPLARPTHKPPAAARPGCSPSFTIDSLGIRHYKPECF